MCSTNPAASVHGPKYVVRRGKTPVLSADQARELLDAIDISELINLFFFKAFVFQ